MKVILETDCQTIISRLRRTSTDLADLDSILKDVLALTYFIDLSHVKRDGNCVAHHLARIIPFGVEQVWDNIYILKM